MKDVSFWDFHVAYCHSCHCPLVDVLEYRPRHNAQGVWGRKTVYPITHGRQEAPPEVAEPYRTDYDEACAVLPHSAKASAALSRRILQMLLRGPGKIPPKKTLAQEIDAAMSSLPDYVGSQLHTLREIGNAAAHPLEDEQTAAILPVEREEAEYTLSVIEELFQHYFVAPARSAERKAAMNVKLTAAGKKSLS